MPPSCQTLVDGLTSKSQEVTKGQMPAEAQREQKPEWRWGRGREQSRRWGKVHPRWGGAVRAQRPLAAQLPSSPDPGLQHPGHQLLWKPIKGKLPNMEEGGQVGELFPQRQLQEELPVS